MAKQIAMDVLNTLRVTIGGLGPHPCHIHIFYSIHGKQEEGAWGLVIGGFSDLGFSSLGLRSVIKKIIIISFTTSP